MPAYLLFVLILFCIIALVCAIFFNCCIHITIQQRLARTFNSENTIRRSGSTISDNYLFSGSDDNYNTNTNSNPVNRTVPEIIPIAIGEKVELEEQDDGFIIIIAE